MSDKQSATQSGPGTKFMPTKSPAATSAKIPSKATTNPSGSSQSSSRGKQGAG